MEIVCMRCATANIYLSGKVANTESWRELKLLQRDNLQPLRGDIFIKSEMGLSRDPQ
jgi:hypothetical protein